MATSQASGRPTIARIWRGRTTRANADAYQAYLHEEGIRPLEAKALGVQMLREDRDQESEFVTISYWEDVQAMSRFTGGDPGTIHHLARDAEFLIELPNAVQVLTIVSASGDCGGGDEQCSRFGDPPGHRSPRLPCTDRN
jgi:hypothetical protein